MKYKKLTFLILVIAAVPMAYADFSYAAEGKCDFLNKTENFSLTKKKSDGSSEAVKSELQSRKELMLLVLDCAQDEVRALEKSVKELEVKDQEVKATKERMAEELGKAIGFYDSQKKAVQDLGIRGSKDMAKTVLEWRTYSYNPLAGSIANLIVWQKNQPLFDAANRRFDQISQMIKSLKLIDEEEISSIYKEGEDKLKQANSANLSAKEGIVRGGSKEEVSESIKTSLETLADTYKAFFELSEAVKSFIPI